MRPNQSCLKIKWRSCSTRLSTMLGGRFIGSVSLLMRKIFIRSCRRMQPLPLISLLRFQGVSSLISRSFIIQLLFRLDTMAQMANLLVKPSSQWRPLLQEVQRHLPSLTLTQLIFHQTDLEQPQNPAPWWIKAPKMTPSPTAPSNAPTRPSKTAQSSRNSQNGSLW